MRYVLVVSGDVDITETLKEKFPDHQKIGDSAWVIRAPYVPAMAGTQGISESLFPRVKGEELPSHVVFRINAYWGYYNRALWEWLD